MQEDDVTDTEKSGVISGVLDSIFTESDDGSMRSNRQLSGGDEGHLETLAETDKSSNTEMFESPKIESLADIESITDGRVILKGNKGQEAKNETSNIDSKTGDFLDDAEQMNEQGEEAENQTENSKKEKDLNENTIEKKNAGKLTQGNATQENKGIGDAGSTADFRML